MSRIRIVCPAPTVEGSVIFFPVLGAFGDAPKVKVFLVLDDGTETELDNVSKVTWVAEPGEIPTAQIEFIDTELDVTTDVDLPKAKPTIPAPADPKPSYWDQEHPKAVKP